MIEGSLTKAALVEEVAHVADLTKKHAGTIVDAVFGSIVVALHDPAAADAHVLHDAPVAVLLAVLAAHLATHEHASIVRPCDPPIKGVGRHYTEIRQATNAEPPGFVGTPGRARREHP